MNKILIVDDEHDIRSLIGDILEDEGFAVHLAANADECLNFLNTEEPDLIILDIWLKDSRMDGIDILRIVKRDNSDVPVVIISGHGNIEIAVAAIKQGAYDFIEKPFNINQLMVVVGRAIENSKLRRENSQFKLKEQPLAKFLGSSTSYRALKSQVDKVSKSNGRVLLSGDSGTGKEVIARYIHSNSTRARAPFVSISCAGIAPDEMEEVLFGRETTERRVELGLLEQAHGGIVYFDEVADMPLGTQSKILRASWSTSISYVRAGPIGCGLICVSCRRLVVIWLLKLLRAAFAKSCLIV
jgi:two-component system, NtrC family, nitrogen regulation response regulator NtrX